MKVLIIGGSTSGTICAWEIRKLNKDCEIIIIEESSNVQYSPCAMPYVISGETARDNIVLLSKNNYVDNNINLLNNVFVKKIIPEKNEVLIKDNNEEKTLSYDFLVIATGSESFNPGIIINSKNCSFFKTLQDMDKIIEETKSLENIVIIGAGFIGVETAHALKSKNKNITLLEAKNQILPEMLDEDMALIVEEYIKDIGINIFKQEFVKEIRKDKIITANKEFNSDYVIISTGVKPRLDVAKTASIVINKGIIVDEYQRTNFSNIYACGDCAEIKCAITKKGIITGLANSAYAQAKTVAHNIIGSEEKTEPSLNSSISKIGDLFIGSAGLNLSKAKNAGYSVVFVKHSSYTTAEYYSTKKEIMIKLVCDSDGVILGAQFISKDNISGYLALINLLIKKKILIKDLVNLETPYNPASNPLHDPLVTAARILLKKLRFLKK